MSKKKQRIYPGHLACAGCGATIAMKLAVECFPEKTVVVIVASCWSVIAGPFPLRTLNFPAIHTAFAAGASTATGIVYGLKARNDEDSRVITWAGDGGTFDIGLQSLSGALERNIRFTYVCYDNEAYMNTGIQRSSATPIFATTTTTPDPNFKSEPKKDLLEIVIAHNIQYAATATIAFPEDLQEKVRKAVSVNGPSVLHIFSPCPTGQGFGEKYTVKISRLAVETGIFPLYEFENGRYSLNYEPTCEGLEEYLNLQSRFKGMNKNNIETMRKNINKRLEILKKKVRMFK